jgi:hypothetical protein
MQKETDDVHLLPLIIAIVLKRKKGSEAIV